VLYAALGQDAELPQILPPFTREDGLLLCRAIPRRDWAYTHSARGPNRHRKRSAPLGLRRQDTRRSLCYAGKRGEIGGV